MKFKTFWKWLKILDILSFHGQLRKYFLQIFKIPRLLCSKFFTRLKVWFSSKFLWTLEFRARLYFILNFDCFVLMLIYKFTLERLIRRTWSESVSTPYKAKWTKNLDLFLTVFQISFRFHRKCQFFLDSNLLEIASEFVPCNQVFISKLFSVNFQILAPRVLPLVRF